MTFPDEEQLQDQHQEAQDHLRIRLHVGSAQWLYDSSR
jgi:hypothetical protein